MVMRETVCLKYIPCVRVTVLACGLFCVFGCQSQDDTLGTISVADGNGGSSVRQSSVSNEAEHKAVESTVVYYFHRKYRCPTCLKIESLALQSLKERFPEAIASSDLEWQVINLDEPGNQSFVEKFELETSTLVLAKETEGSITTWKKLEKVWSLVVDEDAFADYVGDEAAGYLADVHGE